MMSASVHAPVVRATLLRVLAAACLLLATSATLDAHPGGHALAPGDVLPVWTDPDTHMSVPASLLYVRDPELLVRVFSTNPSYLRSSADGEVTQYKDWGIPLGRRFRSMKLWFHLRLAGAESIRARLRRDLSAGDFRQLRSLRRADRRHVGGDVVVGKTVANGR